jgi:UDP-N-acetylglucosamine enolpyruvyl transferase
MSRAVKAYVHLVAGGIPHVASMNESQLGITDAKQHTLSNLTGSLENIAVSFHDTSHQTHLNRRSGLSSIKLTFSNPPDFPSSVRSLHYTY